jgi:hypothetical protein
LQARPGLLEPVADLVGYLLPAGFSCESRVLHPLLWHGLRALMGKQPGAARLLLGCDTRLVFAILGTCRHRLFYRRALADLIKPARFP